MRSKALLDRSKDDDLSDIFLTTKQVAALLHVQERKIYDMAASGEIPGTRAFGKWLFNREAIHHWLESHGNNAEVRRRAAPPNVLLGSHDPLLEWAIRESNSGLATFLDGSRDGVERFANAEGVIAGVHIPDAANSGAAGGTAGNADARWNGPSVTGRFENHGVALIEWAWRDRGLIMREEDRQTIREFSDIRGRRIAIRQEGAGSRILFDREMARHGVDADDCIFLKPSRSEQDAVLRVREEEADVAFGLRCVARQFALPFIPVTKERFDLLIWHREWFEPPAQRLIAFARTVEFKERAKRLTGYEIGGFGTVHFNGNAGLLDE
ncbi:helix-turn-helix transcriptional regulator [Marivibrio halodurans]|uniref:Helix-turn-helix transcriptional regulator n=1 Tax=Marivibrio halodurans TaxID=2039722 RepID=A0A8J7S1W1_9PROT|nr:helix-turn-helix transcriptional regulator [Marivibrio halodurans]MBP5858340.1 helix-turn-helix transcriptional regulator [Marivibrio halodurans]